MEIILIAVIIVLIAYAVFKDILYSRHLEMLERKLIARNLTDYRVNTAPPNSEENKNKIAQPDNLVDLNEVPNPFLHKPVMKTPGIKAS